MRDNPSLVLLVFIVIPILRLLREQTNVIIVLKVFKKRCDSSLNSSTPSGEGGICVSGLFYLLPLRFTAHSNTPPIVTLETDALLWSLNGLLPDSGKGLGFYVNASSRSAETARTAINIFAGRPRRRPWENLANQRKKLT